MSWNLVQKILSYILFYGADIIKIYAGLIKIAEKQIKFHFDLIWMPIIILLVAYSIFGIMSAVIGIKAGKFIKKKSLEPQQISDKNNFVVRQKQETFKYSIAWLIVNICLIVTGLVILKLTNWYIWTTLIAVIASVWIFRYRRALKKISKPKFWIIFVIITMITVFVFSRINGGEDYFIKGILAGIQMNFRAILMVLGFAVIAVELYNPLIRNFFQQSSFRQLPLALELATESLPTFIAALPDFKTALKNPTTIFYSVILHADKRIKDLADDFRKGNVFIVTGEKNEGKTSLVKKIANEAKEKSINVGGILSEKIMKNSECVGYDVVDIRSGEKSHFLIKGDLPDCQKIMKFSILEDGLLFGNTAIMSAMEEMEFIIIDEVGLLEIENGGWHKSILITSIRKFLRT